MITIYSTKTCAFCHAAKQYLSGKGIDYTEIKVDEISNGPEMLIEKSGQLGVPVIDVDGQVIVGFNREALEVVLRDKKLI